MGALRLITYSKHMYRVKPRNAIPQTTIKKGSTGASGQGRYFKISGDTQKPTESPPWKKYI